MSKKKIAVFFGGRSPEHDVSIVTGLQVLDALRADLYETIPVYVSRTGEWFAGEVLRDRKIYIPTPEVERRLSRVTLGYSSEGLGVLKRQRRAVWSGADIQFDIAIPAFHGTLGEDGCFQGTMEFAGIPYVGMRHLASAIGMDKAATKALVESKTRVPQLPYRTVFKTSAPPAAPDLPKGSGYPVIVKPAHMGSSIGVAKADSPDEVQAVLRMIFVYDFKAIIEPFIVRRREYNIAVRRAGLQPETSAIEMPKSETELLDFREKYLRGSGSKKAAGGSEGMLSLTRDINPAIEQSLETNLRSSAVEIFNALDGSGTPRLDFILDESSGELWFNEINPCPGSFAFYLWEAAARPLLFSEVLNGLIEEAIYLRGLTEIPIDPVPKDARLFERK